MEHPVSKEFSILEKNIMNISISSIRTALTTAIKNNTHPFRYFTLATVNAIGVPYTRTVVLRNIDIDLIMTICTDKRSRKILHIEQQNKVSLLFLDPIKSIQLVIQAEVQESQVG